MRWGHRNSRVGAAAVVAAAVASAKVPSRTTTAPMQQQHQFHAVHQQQQHQQQQSAAEIKDRLLQALDREYNVSGTALRLVPGPCAAAIAGPRWAQRHRPRQPAVESATAKPAARPLLRRLTGPGGSAQRRPRRRCQLRAAACSHTAASTQAPTHSHFTRSFICASCSRPFS